MNRNFCAKSQLASSNNDFNTFHCMKWNFISNRGEIKKERTTAGYNEFEMFNVFE